jgi:hypothetical protein
MNEEQIKVIRDLYEDLVTYIRANPDSRPQEAMVSVASRWYYHKQGPFSIALEVFEQNGENPAIWREVKTTQGIREKVVTFELLPFGELPLGFDRFGEGGSFFDLFEIPEAGLCDDTDPQPDDYAKLCELINERNRTFGVATE